jgi:hypothetical protein
VFSNKIDCISVLISITYLTLTPAHRDHEIL